MIIGSRLGMVLLLVAACFGVVAVAEVGGAGPLAGRRQVEMRVTGTEIGWLPKGEHGTIVLAVSTPDGVVMERSFPDGSYPYLDLAEEDAGLFPDGVYTFELQLLPADLRQRSHRAGGDGDATAVSAVIPDSETLTGYFTVRNGAIVPSDMPEILADRLMDVVYSDDMIINGSLCVGYDCANGENFGFDTIRMKENNIQIAFDDTSTIAGFPANDWQIVANDSMNGGGSYFAIQDVTANRTPFRVEAGAPTGALFVKSSGRVGIGTATPALRLQIKYGDTPGVRLEQDNTIGWSAYTWDISGNESNLFIRDVTGGSRLPLRIQPGTPTNTLTLRSNNRVGLGTWTPESDLEVERTGANAEAVMDRTDGAKVVVRATDTRGEIGTLSPHGMRLIINGVPRVNVKADGQLVTAGGAQCTSGGAWLDASSRDFKENVRRLPANEALTALAGLEPVLFNYKVEPGETSLGFIAEDVPALVATSDRRALSAMEMVAVLTRVVQEQQKAISVLQPQVAELEKKKAE